jgi:hypothetical protein
MKKYALVTTWYCKECNPPSKEHLIQKFNYDGDADDIYLNFSNQFDPWHKDNLNVGHTGNRPDLVKGKIFLLRDFVKENILNKYEYICHIDYSDTKFARSYIEMMKDFESTGEDFIISTEKNCWPYLYAVQSWVDYVLEDKEFEYVNSGAIISKTEVYYDYLVKLSDICLSTPLDFWDDQGVWQYYNVKIKKLNSDKTSKYFFSTALLDESYYSIDKKGIKTKFETYPYLIHDNSSFSLNLINKI